MGLLYSAKLVKKITSASEARRYGFTLATDQLLNLLPDIEGVAVILLVLVVQLSF